MADITARLLKTVSGQIDRMWILLSRTEYGDLSDIAFRSRLKFWPKPQGTMWDAAPW